MLAACGGTGEGDKADIAGALDCDRQRTLVAGACAELPSRLDLAPFPDMSPQPGDVLVIDVPDVVDAEGADLAPG